MNRPTPMRAYRLSTAIRVAALVAIFPLVPATTVLGSDCTLCDAPTVTLHFKLQGQLAGTVETTLSGGDEETVHVLSGGAVQLDSGSGRYVVQSFGCGEWSGSEDVTVHLGEVITWNSTWVIDETDPAYTEMETGYPTPLLMNVSFPEAPCLRFFVQVPGSAEFVPYVGELITAAVPSAPGQVWRFKVEIGTPSIEGTLAAADSSNPVNAGRINADPKQFKFHNSTELGPLCGTMPAGGASSIGGDADNDADNAGLFARIIPEPHRPARRAATVASGLRAVQAFNQADVLRVDVLHGAGGAARHFLESRSVSAGHSTTLQMGPVVREEVVPVAISSGNPVDRTSASVQSPVTAGLGDGGDATPQSSPPPGVTPGEFLARAVGSLYMELALGTGLGSLIYETAAIDSAAYSPGRLRFGSAAGPLALYSDSQGAIRQALFPTGLLDVVVVDASRFEVRFFGFDQFHDSGSGFVIDDDNPRQSWVIENPDSAPAGRVRFTGVRDGVTQVHLATWQPPEASDAGQMTLSLFDDSVIAERTYYLDTASATPTRSERVTRRRGVGGAVEQDLLVVYGEFYHWGDEGEVFEAVVAEIEDPDGAALATYYGYYDQTTQPGGNLAWVIHPDGYWEAYNRYQTTGDLAQTFRPWIDDPADPSLANASNTLVTTVTYQYPQPNIEVKIEDTIWKNSVRTGYRIITTTLDPDGPITETTETFLSATSSTVSETVKASWQGPLLGSYEARGTLRTLNRTWGYWDPASREFWLSPGAGRVVAERTIEIEGTLAQPGGIENETTIELRYTDDRGRALLEETYVNDGDPFLPGSRSDWIAQRINVYNTGGQVVETSENGRVVFEAGYDPDGRMLWSRDDLGIRTDLEYDAFDRVFRTVRVADAGTPDRTTTFEFDSAGRVATQTVEAGSGADARSETTTFDYDLAGRLIQTATPYGLIHSESETMLTGANGAPQRRQTVTTNPDGSQEITEFYRDRRIFRRYGPAVPAEFWGYGVNGYGNVSAAFRDLAGTQLRAQRIADWAGNTVFDVLPGFTGQGFHVTSNTFGGSGPSGTIRGLLVSRNVPERAPELFEYDEQGRLVATGLDLDANGVLERVGSDPISISQVAFENLGAGSGWSQVARTTRLETDNSTVETLVSERREKLGVIPAGLVASVETREPGGSRSRTEVAVDRSTTTRTTTVRDLAVAGSTPPATAREVGGLLRSIRTPEASADTVYFYDALERVTSVTSPLSGTMTYGYDASGRLESTTDSLSRETSLTYHAQGQPGAGQVATSRDPAGNTTHFAYNSRGGLWRQWGVNVYPQEFGYNDDNQLTSLRTFRTKDAPAAGGVDWKSAVWPANAPSGDQTQWIYDTSGLLSRKQYADSTEVVYGYDTARRVASRTNARGQTVEFSYNDLGQMEAKTYPVGGLTSDCVYIYDRAGRARSITDASGTRQVAFDPETGGVTGETYTAGLLAGMSVGRSFDEFGRQESLDVPSVLALGWEYDEFGRPVRITGTSGTASGLDVTYVREPGSDWLQNIEWRHGGVLRLQSGRAYDAISRLTAVTTRDGQETVLQSHGYSSFDELDRRKRVDREDGTYWNYDYDLRSQLTGAIMKDSTGSALSGHEFVLVFDTIGNRVQSAAGTLGSSYESNALNQYLQRTVPSAIRVMGSAAADTFVTAGFQPAERMGDWFNVEIPVDNSSGAVWKEFDVVAVRSDAGPSGEDEVASASRSAFVAHTPEVFTHDLDGNLTGDGRWIYTWDAENRLVAMETRSEAMAAGVPGRRLEFVYDCGSRRVSKKVSNWTGTAWALASHTLFIYDGWNLIAELDALSGRSLSRSYVWGLDLSGSNQGAGGVGGLLGVIDANGAHAPWWDGNGNVTGYSNLESGIEEARYTYGPFGETLGATGPLASTFTHRFSSKFTDPETDLLYYGFRYYSPSTGRWLSREPLGEGASRNLYTAGSNNLVGKIDVLGLYEEAGHFYTVFSVAVAAGHSQADAIELAYYAQLADEFAPLDAKSAYLAHYGDPAMKQRALGMKAKGSVSIGSYIAGSRVGINEFGRNVQELIHSLHGLSGDELLKRRECVGILIRDDSLRPWQRGLLLHAFGDTFAHVDSSGRAYSYPDGHGDDSLADRIPGGRDLTDPDIIGNYPDRYRAYTLALYDVLQRPDGNPALVSVLTNSSLMNIRGSEQSDFANSIARAVAIGGFKYPSNGYAPEAGNVLDPAYPTPSATEVNDLFTLLREECCVGK